MFFLGCFFWFERLDLDVFVGFVLTIFLRAVFFWRFMVCCFSEIWISSESSREAKNVSPPTLTELPNVTFPKTLENRFVPFPVFLLMPVTRDCGHCSS